MSSTMEVALERGDVDETEVRGKFEAAAAEDGRPLSQIAPETGVAYATLSAWRSGKYQGNNARVAVQVQQWLNTIAARQRTRATLPRAPDFRMTETASKIWDLLEHAQTANDMVIITGGAGVGKTQAIRAYQRQAANVHVVTVEPCVSTTTMLLDLLLQETGSSVVGSALRKSSSLKKRLAGTGGLLILDDAQHLSAQLLDQLRHIYDATEIGIALVGNETVFARLGADERRAGFGQLFSRIGLRMRLNRPRKKDAETLLDAWGVTDKDARKFAIGVALKPGAHRVMTKTLRIAHAIAAASGAGTELTAGHIEDAWKQLTADGGAA